MSLQKLAVIVAVAFAGLTGGCSGKTVSLAQLDGSEPQRLSYGDPKTVHAHFEEKVRACWFNASGPLHQGYSYDAARSDAANDGQGEQTAAPPHILVYSGELSMSAQQKAAFEVEFHGFNGNTLISTRNKTLPADLAARLKKDVETWLLDDKGCGSSRAQVAAVASPAAYVHSVSSAPTGATHLMPASYEPGRGSLADALSR